MTAPNGWQKSNPCYIVGPHNTKRWPGDDRVANHFMPAKPGDMLALALDLVEEIAAKYPIDRSRIYLYGHNQMGGATALAAAAYRPELFAGVFAFNPTLYRDLAKKIGTVPVVIDGDANPEGAHATFVNEVNQAGNANAVLIAGDKGKALEAVFKHKRP